MTAFGINDAHTRDLDASLHARESHRGAAAGTAQTAQSDH